MRPSDIIAYKAIHHKLNSFSAYPVPGIQDAQALDCFIKQIVDSTRRIKYMSTILAKSYDASVSDATSIAFNPLKAAIWHMNQGNINEAFWLIFLFTHFGKNSSTGWNLIRTVYGGTIHPVYWDWQRTSSDPNGFCTWIRSNIAVLKAAGGFGNHRKYESLMPKVSKGTCDTVASYIDWVGPTRDHNTVIANAKASVGNNPQTLFNYLYYSMNSVHRFGRTAKFDYLATIGKLGLVTIEPASVYVDEATGPARGAKLLFGGNTKASLSNALLSDALTKLGKHLGLYFGMQVLEDSLCNWQKSPDSYIHFSA